MRVIKFVNGSSSQKVTENNVAKMEQLFREGYTVVRGEGNVLVVEHVTDYVDSSVAAVQSLLDELFDASDVPFTNPEDVEQSQSILAAVAAVAQGASAYDVYVATTLDEPVLDEEAWLETLVGADGEDGADGKTILNGTAVPVNEGVLGDFYLKTDTSDLYGPKTGGGWGSATSLIGEAGADGLFTAKLTYCADYAALSAALISAGLMNAS